MILTIGGRARADLADEQGVDPRPLAGIGPRDRLRPGPAGLGCDAGGTGRLSQHPRARARGTPARIRCTSTTGRWLAEHSAGSDRVLDLTDWSLFFSERPGYPFAHVYEAPVRPERPLDRRPQAARRGALALQPGDPRPDRRSPARRAGSRRTRTRSRSRSASMTASRQRCRRSRHSPGPIRPERTSGGDDRRSDRPIFHLLRDAGMSRFASPRAPAAMPARSPRGTTGPTPSGPSRPSRCVAGRASCRWGSSA